MFKLHYFQHIISGSLFKLFFTLFKITIVSHRSYHVINFTISFCSQWTTKQLQTPHSSLQQIHSLSMVYNFKIIWFFSTPPQPLVTHLEYILPLAGSSSSTWGIFPFLVCMNSFKYQIKYNHHAAFFPYTLTAE